MDNVVDRGPAGEKVLGSLDEIGPLFAHVDERVLAIPNLHSIIIPDRWPNEVEGAISETAESSDPRILQLQVDMFGAKLPWDGSREQHHVSKRAQGGYEAVGPVRREMLSDLKARCEIETSADVGPLCAEVRGYELRVINEQASGPRMLPIDADYVADTERTGRLQPCPDAATKIDH